MKASGIKWTILIDDKTYYFDRCSIVCVSKVLDTPLVGGGLYRLRSMPMMYEITIGGKVEHSEYESYRSLLASAAAVSKDIRIGTTTFSSCMLSRGSFRSEDGEEKAEFEMTVTGVSSS